MKFLTGFFVFAAFIIPAISAAAVTNSNHPLYSLENVLTYVVSQDAQALFTIEETDSGSIFVRRDIATENTTLSVPLEVPSAYLMNAVIVNETIYVFHVRILDREKRSFETSVFAINGESGQMKTLYKSEELKGFAERFYATKNGLLLTEKRGNNPYFFSFDENEMTPIKLDDDFRIRSFDLEKNCAVIIRQNNFSTNFESRDGRTTYTEGDGGLLDVFLCDFSHGFSLKEIGQYQPSYVLSENEKESFLPHFIIESKSFSWVGPSFMVNRFPVYPGALIADTFLYSTWESLVGYGQINEITFMGDEYVVARQFSEIGETSLVVFDIRNPKLTKTETVAKEDRDRIKALFNQQFTTEKSALSPAVTGRIFDAKFYKVSLVTTTVDSSDGSVMTMTSTESFIAVASGATYSVLKGNEELLSFVSSGFVLNEKSAPHFQEALDVLYPVGHFAGKHKEFYNIDHQWIFVRDESFGKKVGIIVTVNGDSEITGIKPRGDVPPKQ